MQKPFCRGCDTKGRDICQLLSYSREHLMHYIFSQAKKAPLCHWLYTNIVTKITSCSKKKKIKRQVVTFSAYPKKRET